MPNMQVVPEYSQEYKVRKAVVRELKHGVTGKVAVLNLEARHGVFYFCNSTLVVQEVNADAADDQPIPKNITYGEQLPEVMPSGFYDVINVPISINGSIALDLYQGNYIPVKLHT